MKNLLNTIFNLLKKFFSKSNSENPSSIAELPEINLAFADLANMLTMEKQNPIPNIEFFDHLNMDYSIESIKHIDEYLLSIGNYNLELDNKIIPVVVRTAAYVGESIRKNDHMKKWYWIDFETAKQKEPHFFNDIEDSLEFAAILTDGNSQAFPLNKVIKFLQNGKEDSLYFFAMTMLSFDEPNANDHV